MCSALHPGWRLHALRKSYLLSAHRHVRSLPWSVWSQIPETRDLDVNRADHVSLRKNVIMLAFGNGCLGRMG
jgi:hypothetical protein